MNTHWTLVCDGGHDQHRLFMNDAQELSIADRSGSNPNHTDDGPLIVDFSKPVELYFSPYGSGIYGTVHFTNGTRTSVCQTIWSHLCKFYLHSTIDETLEKEALEVVFLVFNKKQETK